MRAPTGDAAGTGTTEPPVSANEQRRCVENGGVENDVRRGGHRLAGRRQPAWPWSLVGRFGHERPPRWFSSPLVLVALVAGFVAFSAAWSLVGDAVVAPSVATIAGTCVCSGTVVAGSVVWIRLAAEPAVPGY